MKQYKKESTFKLIQFNWVFVADSIVVVGAVMAYGLIATCWLGMNSENALSMLAIIPLMILAVSLGTVFTLRSVRRKMDDLLIGIKEVSNGNLDVQLDCKKADEYAPIYDGFNRMAAELKNTKTEMQNFINDFSHEFNTPITSISGTRNAINIFRSLPMNLFVCPPCRSPHFCFPRWRPAKLSPKKKHTIYPNK